LLAYEAPVIVVKAREVGEKVGVRDCACAVFEEIAHPPFLHREQVELQEYVVVGNGHLTALEAHA